ncbi:sensory box protein/sigma-54 dependent DNA-binding response regulator [Minicystis rosea]|nr:sensory box protein/sigma-54 dependent DNA-binding response regulator [Minicystis rosea]
MPGETFRTTIDESVLITDAQDSPVPGLVLIFCGGKPCCTPMRLDGKPIVLGRYPADDVTVVDDDRVSRRHTRITARGDGVRVTDLDSRNGTYVDGLRISDETYAKPPRVLRLGQSLLIFVPDVRVFRSGEVEVTGGEVIGPTLQKARLAVERAAEGGDSLLLTGPSGAGKELAARAFHAASGAGGAFVAVNCATIPAGLAERLLFGARKGAYSGATTDSEGYVQAADGGTLFLDEVAELDASVQPKLLRVLELHEVVSLGASHPRKVDVRICAATLKDLRGEVQAGRFREDLYYRIGRPEVRLPALVERLEDLPWLVARELAKVDPKLTAHPLLVEACALRAWPGNVRELLGEIRRAGREALADNRTVVKDRDLAESAGREIEAAKPITGPIAPASPSEVTREAIEAALRKEQGNVTRAARTLGLHRNQLRRWISKNSVDPKAFGPGDDDGGDAEPQTEVNDE